MELIKDLKELKKIVEELEDSTEESFELQGTWKISVDVETFEVAKSDCLVVMSNIDDDFEEVGFINLSLAVDLMKKRILFFDDIGFDDNEEYVYSFNVDRLLTAE
jgi:predicted transcriptional regulator